jgi:hypothetical protein
MLAAPTNGTMGITSQLASGDVARGVEDHGAHEASGQAEKEVGEQAVASGLDEGTGEAARHQSCQSPRRHDLKPHRPFPSVSPARHCLARPLPFSI